MIPLEVLRELYDYNYWARDRQLEACSQLSQEDYTRPMGASYGSLRDTLTHLLGGEWIWLERWRGRNLRSLIPVEEVPTLAALGARWQQVEREMREYVAGLTNEALERPLTYTNIKGVTWTYPLWQTLFHLTNHQSYHRGQVTTLLRQLGATPAAVDYLVYRDLRR